MEYFNNSNLNFWLTHCITENTGWHLQVQDLVATIWRTVNLALLCWCHQCWCFWAFLGGSCSSQLKQHEPVLLQYRPIHTKHPWRVEKTEISLRINTIHDHTQYVQQYNTQNKVLTKCKSTDSYSDGQNVHSDAFIASNAHALFGSLMVYITTRANYDSTERTVLKQSLNLTYWKVRDTHQMCSTVQIHQTFHQWG